jgi:ketosteroid isomerase-like protein
VSSEAVRAQVLAANRAFYDAFEALDIEAMEALWDAGDEAACVHPGAPWVRGWDEVRSSWEAILGATGYIELEVVDPLVEVRDPVAWVTCVERISSAGPGGRGTADVAATNVFVLGAEGWRMVLHHASPLVRPPVGVDETS